MRDRPYCAMGETTYSVLHLVGLGEPGAEADLGELCAVGESDGLAKGHVG